MQFFLGIDIHHLGDAICNALHRALHDHTKPEPQLVANLVFELPKQINMITPTGTTKVRAGGIFVHAQPFVTCKSFPDSIPKSVEIGDLLLIRTLVKNNTVIERRALLLQAKKAKSIPAVPDNENQWHLYERWPEFTYASKSVELTGKIRHIKEPDMYDAAKYWLLGSERHCHPHILHTCLMSIFYNYPDVFGHYTAQPTRPDISRYRLFASEILDLLIGNAGKTFITPPPGTNGWDQVIDDLINVTGKARSKLIAHSANQSGRSARGNGIFSFMTSAGQSSHYLVANGDGTENSDRPPDVPNEWVQSDEDSGISIIEMIVEQGDN